MCEPVIRDHCNPYEHLWAHCAMVLNAQTLVAVCLEQNVRRVLAVRCVWSADCRRNTKDCVVQNETK